MHEAPPLSKASTWQGSCLELLLYLSTSRRTGLDGICRWNSARASEAVQQPVTENLRTFNSKLQARVNQLSQSILGEVVFSNYKPPSKYTCEQFGVQYLYQQSGRSLTTTQEQLNVQIDEGFADVDDMDKPAVSAPPEQDEHLTTVAPPIDGLYVTTTEAEKIKELHSELLEYDRSFRPRPVKATSGRVARSKGGYTSVDAIKR